MENEQIIHERTMTIQECANWKIDMVIEDLQKLKANPDMMHTQDGLNALYFTRDIATDLIEWIKEKMQTPRLYVLPRE